MTFHLVLQQIFPLYAAYRADSIVKRLQCQVTESELSFGIEDENSIDINSRSESTNQLHIGDSRSKKLNTSSSLLKEFSKDELDRKKIIEEKARALLFIISATIAITTGSLAYISQLQLSNVIIEVAVASLLIGFLYLIFAIINTIKSLHVYEYYYILPADYFEEQDSTIKLSLENEVRIVNKLYKNLKLNSLINLRRGNHLSASFTNIRNGVISIAFFFMLVLFSKITAPSTSQTPIRESKASPIPMVQPVDSVEQEKRDSVQSRHALDSSSHGEK